MFLIPDNFARFIEVQHETDGLAWLARLPSILATCEQRWHLKIGIFFTNLSYHYAAPAVRDDGTPVVVNVFSPTGEFALQLDFERARVRGWGVYQAVLASWWGVEDTGQLWDEALQCAELLAAIKL